MLRATWKLWHCWWMQIDCLPCEQRPRKILAVPYVLKTNKVASFYGSYFPLILLLRCAGLF